MTIKIGYPAVTATEAQLAQIRLDLGIGDGAPEYNAQFSTLQSGLMTDSVPMSATGIAVSGPCAIVGIHCVTVGTGGPVTIHDDIDASDATRLRFSRAVANMTAGTYYPLVDDAQCAMLFDNGAYFTNSSSGVYVLDVVATVSGAAGSGLLCAVERVTASGIALAGPASIVSIKVIAAGSAGNFSIHEDVIATDATKLRYPTTAYTSLAADQVLRFGVAGVPRRLQAMYITMPTDGIVLVNHLPR